MEKPFGIISNWLRTRIAWIRKRDPHIEMLTGHQFIVEATQPTEICKDGEVFSSITKYQAQSASSAMDKKRDIEYRKNILCCSEIVLDIFLRNVIFVVRSTTSRRTSYRCGT